MKNLLVTGAAGFIGSNAVARFTEKGWNVFGLDDFSREGTRRNAEWLTEVYGVPVDRCDVRSAEEVAKKVKASSPDAVLHLAAQVAVTESVELPRVDLDTNIVGTVNVLEAVREYAPTAHVIYASTNKVYGELADVETEEGERRYHYDNLPEGVGEDQPLQFRTPYGCSKGAADQYVLDYFRTFGVRGTSLRQSCIYGPRQIGVEDQGWVAWFARAALAGRTITIFGDGKQVRDLLHIEDLLDLFEAVFKQSKTAAGRAYNVGGGEAYSRSLLEVLEVLENELGENIDLEYDDWRPGDQRVFYCNVTRAQRELGWEPRIPPEEGLQDLIGWMRRQNWLIDPLQEEDRMGAKTIV